MSGTTDTDAHLWPSSALRTQALEVLVPRAKPWPLSFARGRPSLLWHLSFFEKNILRYALESGASCGAILQGAVEERVSLEGQPHRSCESDPRLSRKG